MPFISMDTNQTSPEKKKALIEGFTKVASEVLGMPPAAFYVTIREMPDENWGVGGKVLSELHAKKD